VFEFFERAAGLHRLATLSMRCNVRNGIEFTPDREENQEPNGYEWVRVRCHGASHTETVTRDDGTTTTTARGWQTSWIEPADFTDGGGI